MDTFAFILDERNYPVLVWDSTQAFIGALRRAQNWSFASVLSEYRAFSGEKPHYLVELSLELLQVRFVADKKSLEPAEPTREQQAGTVISQAAEPEQREEEGDDDDDDDDLAVRQLPPDDNTRVTVVLPQEEYLPEWFKRQQWRDEQMRVRRR
jgi:hypothetical protein